MLRTFRVVLVAAAYGLILAGQIVLLPVARAEGGRLERIARHAAAWQRGHQLLAAGAVFLIPAGLALYSALRPSSPRLAAAGFALQAAGASALIGQYALDFALLELAQADSRAAGEQTAAALRENASANFFYFQLADAFLLGCVCFAIAALRDPSRRWRAGVPAWIGLGVMVACGGSSPLALRVGIGLLGVGFTLAAVPSKNA